MKRFLDGHSQKVAVLERKLDDQSIVLQKLLQSEQRMTRVNLEKKLDEQNKIMQRMEKLLRQKSW